MFRTHGLHSRRVITQKCFGRYIKRARQRWSDRLLDPARAVDLHDRAVTLVGERDEFFQRVEFVVFVFETVGIGNVRIGDERLRRLGADLQNNRLRLAPPLDAGGAIDSRRNGEVSALASVAVSLLFGGKGCARQRCHRQKDGAIHRKLPYLSRYLPPYLPRYLPPYLPAAFLKAALMRSCQPGPSC